jgi:hypothetical protein
MEPAREYQFHAYVDPQDIPSDLPPMLQDFAVRISLDDTFKPYPFDFMDLSTQIGGSKPIQKELFAEAAYSIMINDGLAQALGMEEEHLKYLCNLLLDIAPKYPDPVGRYYKSIFLDWKGYQISSDTLLGSLMTDFQEKESFGRPLNDRELYVKGMILKDQSGHWHDAAGSRNALTCAANMGFGMAKKQLTISTQ